MPIPVTSALPLSVGTPPPNQPTCRVYQSPFVLLSRHGDVVIPRLGLGVTIAGTAAQKAAWGSCAPEFIRVRDVATLQTLQVSCNLNLDLPRMCRGLGPTMRSARADSDVSSPCSDVVFSLSRLASVRRTSPARRASALPTRLCTAGGCGPTETRS